MDRLVNDVLKFAGTSNKKMELQPVVLNSFLRETMTSFVKSHKKSISIKFSIDPRLGRTRINIDKNMIRFALEDIVKNAVEVPFSTTLKVKAKIGKNYEKKGKVITMERVVVITLANNGEIIDKEVIKDVFNPFMTTKTNGTGLGLANARAIIEAHHGKIWVERKDDSAAKYRTKFKIHLVLNN